MNNEKLPPARMQVQNLVDGKQGIKFAWPNVTVASHYLYYIGYNSLIIRDTVRELILFAFCSFIANSRTMIDLTQWRITIGCYGLKMKCYVGYKYTNNGLILVCCTQH